jgi:hypothetical protein
MEKGLLSHKIPGFGGDENILDAGCLGVNRFALQRIQSRVD